MTPWSTADFILLGVLFLTGLRGAWKGFMRAFFDVLAVVVAFGAGTLLYKDGAVLGVIHDCYHGNPTGHRLRHGLYRHAIYGKDVGSAIS